MYLPQDRSLGSVTRHSRVIVRDKYIEAWLLVKKLVPGQISTRERTYHSWEWYYPRCSICSCLRLRLVYTCLVRNPSLGSKSARRLLQTIAIRGSWQTFNPVSMVGEHGSGMDANTIAGSGSLLEGCGLHCGGGGGLIIFGEKRVITKPCCSTVFAILCNLEFVEYEY